MISPRISCSVKFLEATTMRFSRDGPQAVRSAAVSMSVVIRVRKATRSFTSGAEARVIAGQSARLEPCPDTNPGELRAAARTRRPGLRDHGVIFSAVFQQP